MGSPLAELPVQYADWVLAHEEWLRGPGAAEQLGWWRRQLAGDLPVLAFPMQRQRPAVRVHAHANGPNVTISIDLAGEGLHRRGYRAQAGEAPLRENLAAASLKLPAALD